MTFCAKLTCMMNLLESHAPAAVVVVVGSVVRWIAAEGPAGSFVLAAGRSVEAAADNTNIHLILAHKYTSH